jgi:hypothetical protein
MFEIFNKPKTFFEKTISEGHLGTPIIIVLLSSVFAFLACFTLTDSIAIALPFAIGEFFVWIVLSLLLWFTDFALVRNKLLTRTFEGMLSAAGYYFVYRVVLFAVSFLVIIFIFPNPSVQGGIPIVLLGLFLLTFSALSLYYFYTLFGIILKKGSSKLFKFFVALMAFIVLSILSGMFNYFITYLLVFVLQILGIII